MKIAGMNPSIFSSNRKRAGLSRRPLSPARKLPAAVLELFRSRRRKMPGLTRHFSSI
jgi:hypothetical protein